MGTGYGTDHNLRTIALLPVQSRSQKLTACDGTNVCGVQLVMRTVIPGVKTPKLGIGLGHRRIPNLHQDDVESKKFLTSKSWGHI